MKKEIHKHIYREEVVICPECIAECTYGENDIDGYNKCTKCGKTDFVGRIKTIDGFKITTEIIELEYEKT